MGRYAGKAGSNSNTHRNSGIGYGSFCNIDDGCCNIGLGQHTGNKLESGSNNVFLGSCSGYYVTTGDYNVLIGAGTSAPSATGDTQMAVGAGSTNWITGDAGYGVSTSNALEAGTFFQNATALAANTTFPASGTKNGGVFGPYTINSSVTLTISSGSTFTII